MAFRQIPSTSSQLPQELQVLAAGPAPQPGGEDPFLVHCGEALMPGMMG